jgi:hypothetical protein
MLMYAVSAARMLAGSTLSKLALPQVHPEWHGLCMDASCSAVKALYSATRMLSTVDTVILC